MTKNAYPRIKMATMAVSLLWVFALVALCLGTMVTASPVAAESKEIPIYSITIRNESGDVVVMGCTPVTGVEFK